MPQRTQRSTSGIGLQKLQKAKAVPLDQIQPGRVDRQTSGDGELDRVLGGGIVPGSITLVGGQPGIGKSTLLLQVALHWPGRVVYVSGEESVDQIKMRSERIASEPSPAMI
ncbi:MAG: AAA family ATPase, partial [Saprospiraceae bacterium]|nr:AAA family ATPase [Saprospiraceae bacterium]